MYYVLTCLLKVPLTLVHVIALVFSSNRLSVYSDARRWKDQGLVKADDASNSLWLVINCLVFHEEFRSLFYYRVPYARVVSFILPPLSSLYIRTREIGPGLFIQHGFATIISATSIGKNCWINQQVTIGYCANGRSPKIEDNVTVNAGAKIIGGVLIGSNSIIGANAVVVKDVPPNVTVVGVPAYIVRRNGSSCRDKL